MLDELEWSDDEDPSCSRYMPFAKKTSLIKSKDIGEDEFEDKDVPVQVITIEEASLCNPHNLFEHKRSYFSGTISIKEPSVNHLEGSQDFKRQSIEKQASEEKVSPDIIKALPTDLTFHFQNSFLNFLWLECEKLETSGTSSRSFDGMVSVHTVCKVMALVETSFPTPPVHISPSLAMELREQYEDDDYVEFVDWLHQLKRHLVTTNGAVIQGVSNATPPTTSATKLRPSFPNKNFPFMCCAHHSCRCVPIPPSAGDNSNNSLEPAPEDLPPKVDSDDENDNDDNDDETDVRNILRSKAMGFRVEVLYNRLKHRLRGKVRVKHAAEALAELRLPVSKQALQTQEYLVHQELLLNSPADMMQWLSKLLDAPPAESTDAAKANADRTARRHRKKLPRWLREEFSPSEVLLYEHHFILTDVDCGGDISGDELQGLFCSLGLSLDATEAQMLIDEYDTDDTGTLDFTEFLVLIYRIQQGTVSLPGHPGLGDLVTQMKTQLPIFEAIEALAMQPPAGVEVVHYGGTPNVVLALRLTCGGVYAQSAPIGVELTLFPGFPYRAPEVLFTSRVVNIHVLTLLDGRGRLLLPESDSAGHGDDAGDDGDGSAESKREWWAADCSLAQFAEQIMTLLTQPNVYQLPAKYLAVAEDWNRVCHATHGLTLLPPQLGQSPQNPQLTMEQVLSKTTADQIVRRFNTLERMHLHTLFLFLAHYEKYLQFIGHAMPKSQPAEPQPQSSQ